MVTLKEKKGIALIVAYLLIALLAVFGGAFFMRSYNENKLALRHRITVQALCIAEAGIERALYDLRLDYLNSEDWSDSDINGIGCGPDTASFYTLHGPTGLGSGSYQVWLKNVPDVGGGVLKDHIRIRSTGSIDEISKTIETYIKIENINIWNNAIFVGSGSEGRLINGNVDIRGSVHLLGDGLTPDQYAIFMSGNAMIGNNYKNMPDELSNIVPDLKRVLYGGEEVETIEATLRVKHGLVGLDSGSSTAGEENIPGDVYKETLDGVYVTDGYGGTFGETNVYSDNGTRNRYELGDRVAFLDLDDAFIASYRAGALVITDPGDLDLFSDLTPESVFSFTDGVNSISMSDGALEITGKVYIDGGDLNMDKERNKTTITYTGSGTILVGSRVVGDSSIGGNVTIKANLLTPDPLPGENSTYPDNIIGIMAPNTITFDRANIKVAAIFYANGSIISQKQTNVAGVFASNSFDISGQVPKIFQVPEVIDHIPEGMIGAEPIWYINVVAWQETK